jgi:hypothetical protein
VAEDETARDETARDETARDETARDEIVGHETDAHENADHENADHENAAGAIRTERTEGMTTTDTGSTELLGTADGRRRGPDPLALLVGLATLAMAVFAFVGELPDMSFADPRWLLAGGAAVVGLALLVGNLRGRPRGRKG